MISVAPDYAQAFIMSPQQPIREAQCALKIYGCNIHTHFNVLRKKPDKFCLMQQRPLSISTRCYQPNLKIHFSRFFIEHRTVCAYGSHIFWMHITSRTSLMSHHRDAMNAGAWSGMIEITNEEREDKILMLWWFLLSLVGWTQTCKDPSLLLGQSAMDWVGWDGMQEEQSSWNFYRTVLSCPRNWSDRNICAQLWYRFRITMLI